MLTILVVCGLDLWSQGHPWKSGPGMYRKSIHSNQAIKQLSSTVLLQFLPLLLFEFLSRILSNYGLCLGHVSQIDSFLPLFLLDMFFAAIESKLE